MALGPADGQLCSVVSETASAVWPGPPTGHCCQPGASASPGCFLDMQTPRCGLHLLSRTSADGALGSVF